MNDNVINLFKEKKSAIPTGETMQESIDYFHSRLDILLETFNELSVFHNFKFLESVVEMNRNIFTLLMIEKEKNK